MKSKQHLSAEISSAKIKQMRCQIKEGEMAKVAMLPQEQAIIDSHGKVVTFGADIAKCEQSNCPQLSALRNQRDDLKRQYNQDVSTLETAIRQRTAQDDQFLLPTSFNKTADRIIQASDKYNSEPGTAVIYPLVLKDKLWLLWATEGKVIGKREITNVGRQKLNQEVLKLLGFLQYPNSDVAELQKSARQLYDWLIHPLEAELKAGNIHHLAFSLDRGTRYIPMAVLFDGEKYLVLGNGEKFSIDDIKVLGDYLHDVHLVVLSACETALGDSFLTDPKQEEGIEINALSFYFLVAGAKTVMASLWRVDDTSTSLLMQRFYCTLANGNTTMTKAQALRKAQLSLLEGTKMPNCPAVSAGEQDFSHPHYLLGTVYPDWQWVVSSDDIPPPILQKSPQTAFIRFIRLI